MENEIQIIPIPKERLNFTGKDIAMKFTLECIKQKKIKKCANFDIVKYGGAYKPTCKFDSFDFRASKSWEYHGDLFHGCPHDCLCYKSKRKTAVINSFKKLWDLIIKTKWSINRGLKSTCNFYKALSSTVQIIIALAILIYIGGATYFNFIVGAIHQIKH